MSKKRVNPDWKKEPQQHHGKNYADSHRHIDLPGRARQEMIANQFEPDFSGAVAGELQSVFEDNPLATQGAALPDLRNLLWSSIDNVESRDLDQLEFAERLNEDQARILVAIADVDAFVKKGSLIDQHAFKNTTSVYTDIVNYPMLPEALSFDATSLLPGQDRLAVVIEIVVGKSGQVLSSDVYRALVCNKAKLNYKMVGEWLEAGGPAPQAIASVSGLPEQILLQADLKEHIKELRQKQGSLHLQTHEASAIIKDGEVVDLQLVESNPARDLIENFMIAANIAVSNYLEARGFASIRRVVRTPEKWDRIVEVAAKFGSLLPDRPDALALAHFLLKRKEEDPDHFPDLSLTIVKLLGRGEYTVEIPGQPDAGHFALAVRDYTHATAPNRRYADLVTQRLLKAIAKGEPAPYTVQELQAVAQQCSERESAANKVERTMRKVSAAVLLSHRIGETFEAYITGVKPEATYIRLIKPPAEGRLVKGDKGLRVGDKVKVRLLSTDPERAYIDFVRR